MDEVVLTVFADGLKPASIVHMPFLNSFSNKRKIKTDLGYSITCHATMYSGFYPDKHKMWFLWKRSPETSPFHVLPDSQLLKYVDSLPTRYFIGKLTRLFSNNTSFGGLAVMKRSSLRNWRNFDLSESKFWDEDNYLDNIPTIFEILRENKIPYETVGLLNDKMGGGELHHIERYNPKKNTSRWIYLFIGGVDYYSHLYTQENEVTIEFLKKMDIEIERIFNELSAQYDNIKFLCFSDHGHMAIKHQFDIYELFKEHKMNLDDFIHIIDTNYARFWFRNPTEEENVRRLLLEMPSGFILEDDHLEKYHTKMPDNRYGDLIYYLDYPYMFKKTVWGYGFKTKSVHGYLPDYKDKDGVFVSNISMKSDEYITLADITPSILELLNLRSKYEFDGNSIWK